MKPLILVEPIGDILPYEYIYFVLPKEEADYWAKQGNAIVSITYKDTFEESQPPFGELISIESVESSPMIQTSVKVGKPTREKPTDLIYLYQYDAQTIREILEAGEWNRDGTPDCIVDCVIVLDDDIKDIVNAILEKYITLDSD